MAPEEGAGRESYASSLGSERYSAEARAWCTACEALRTVRTHPRALGPLLRAAAIEAPMSVDRRSH